MALVPGGPHRCVTQVSAGYCYIAALCGTGEVLTWGGNDYGELGHGDVKPRATPTVVDAFHGQGAPFAVVVSLFFFAASLGFLPRLDQTRPPVFRLPVHETVKWAANVGLP